MFCVCMYPKYSQTGGVSLPRELGEKKNLNFPLEQVSIYMHNPLHDSIVILLLTAFKAAVIKDWPLSVFHSFSIIERTIAYKGNRVC